MAYALLTRCYQFYRSSRRSFVMGNNPLGGIGGLLGSLFGQGTQESDIRRFQDQVSSGQHQQLDDQEVQQRYRQVLRNASPDVVQDAHAQAFSQLDPQQ